MAKLDELRELVFPEKEDEPAVVETPQEAEAEVEAAVDEVAGDEPEELETAERDDDEIVTLASLAADLEIEPATLYGMKIPVEGMDAPLTIGELKDIAQGTYEKYSATESKSQELTEREQEIETKLTELDAQLSNVQPTELIKAEADLARAYADINAIDWPQLEATNPGQAALQRQKLAEQVQIATYNRDQINQTMEATRSEIQSQREQAAQAQTARAFNALQSLIPEWRDEKVYIREREHMVNQLVDAGIPEQSVRGIADPTLIKYLRDSLSRDNKIQAVKEKVKAPTVLKASAIQSAGRGKVKADERFFKQAAASKDARMKDEAIRRLVFGR